MIANAALTVSSTSRPNGARGCAIALNAQSTAMLSSAMRGSSTRFFARKYAERESAMPELGAHSRQKTARSAPKTRSELMPSTRPTPSERIMCVWPASSSW